jgi:hypothetical protein
MMWFCYFLVMAGYTEISGKFWESLFWPYSLGKILARAALDAIKEG